MYNPFKHSFIQCLSQRLTGELRLEAINNTLTNEHNCHYITCSIFCDRTVKSLPVLILGFKRAFVNSATEIPNNLHIFWAAKHSEAQLMQDRREKNVLQVLSGKTAWSVLRSCLNFKFPKCRTADATLWTAANVEKTSNSTKRTVHHILKNKPDCDIWITM